MDDLIAEFLTETNESLGLLDADIVKLEQNPNDTALLSQIFRLMHTIKGTCGFIGLPRLEKVAHKAEDVLGLFRDGVLKVTPSYVTLILESLDRIKFIVGEIEAKGAEPEGDDSELIARLVAVYESAGSAAPQVMSSEELNAAPSTSETPGNPHADPVAAEHTAAEHVEEPIAKESAVAAQSLRVNVEVLENLMTMVSELVLTRNQLLQILRMQKETEFARPLQRLNHVVSDLQEGVMKTRMQPIGNAWAKLPRIIRDLSRELGKKIDLDMRGAETELDRQVLEMIKDPLTHMVRNSADHGIERPHERLAAGKPETGKVRLNSYHEGGHIIIEVADDGKGLSTDKIKKKIIEKSLASAEELAGMSVQQIQQFIFKAGFSTAEKVTSVSGRGVGMDVVRTNIERIGGSIEMKSVEGKGSAFIIKIPLTLAIVSALIVESAGERFAIPQLAVRELVMTSATGDNRIETIKGTPVFRLRDRLLPLVSLESLLKMSGSHNENSESRKQDEAKYTNKYIIVTEVGAYLFGIIVDRVFDTEEIVIKPVARMIKSIEMFSGNTILGDGSVIMILDPAGIAKSSGNIDAADMMEAKSENDDARTADATRTPLLLFAAGHGAPRAVPLELVSRLEEIEASQIEYANGQMVVQYRGQLMPLLPFDAAVDVSAAKRKPVLVFTDENAGRSMGLIVDSIIDIKEERLDIKMAGNAETLLGSAIIDGKATDIINVAHFLFRVNRDWFKNHGDAPFESPGGKAHKNSNGNGHDIRHVLLVEDSPFFRNMLTPLLRMAGYEVTTAENGVKALALCEAGGKFDIIVSDIEMPEMSGFEFAEKIRADSNYHDVPMVALSSHATPRDMDRGREAGFNHYVAKFDRENLLAALSQTFSETLQQKAAS